jgi:hypothetical protein
MCSLGLAPRWQRFRHFAFPQASRPHFGGDVESYNSDLHR